jgi:hypothetical protein
MCNEIPSHTQVMMFRRASIESLRFDSKLTLSADTHFALQTFLQGGVIFTDEVLAEVRLYQNKRDAAETAVHRLNALKALAPHVTRSVDLADYHARLVKGHIDTALDQTNTGRVRAGLGTYRDALRIPGSQLSKIRGWMRLALALPKGICRSP